jgi:hypothetical protein
MRQNEPTDANTDTPSETGAAARRRQFIKGIAIPPTAAALAGCSRVGIGDDPSDPIVEDLQPGDETGFPGAIRFGERYAMEMTRGSDGTKTLSGRFHHADRVIEFGGDGNAVTSYVVDGDGYVVTADDCIEYPGITAELQSVAEIDDRASEAASDPELTVTGRTTIDGREMLVLEPASGAPAENEQALTYYADEETRYLRRIETGTTTVDYHSWNEVEPIETPEMDCAQNG